MTWTLNVHLAVGSFIASVKRDSREMDITAFPSTPATLITEAVLWSPPFVNLQAQGRWAMHCGMEFESEASVEFNVVCYMRFVCVSSPVEVCVFARIRVTWPVQGLQAKACLYAGFMSQQRPLRGELQRLAQVCPGASLTIIIWQCHTIHWENLTKPFQNMLHFFYQNWEHFPPKFSLP